MCTSLHLAGAGRRAPNAAAGRGEQHAEQALAQALATNGISPAVKGCLLALTTS